LKNKKAVHQFSFNEKNIKGNMSKRRRFKWLAVFVLIIGCNQQTKIENGNQVNFITTDSVHVSKEIDFQNKLEMEQSDSLIKRLSKMSDTSEHHFKYELLKSPSEKFLMFAGYKQYSEDEFVFNNPAYLKIFKDEKLIFEDSFKGYSDIRFQDFGGYLFNDSIQLFTLTYGLEACDYINSSRLYFISDKKVGLIDEFDSQSTDWASRYPTYRFPSDSGGVKNHILVIDNIYYKDGEETDKADTVDYLYEDGLFKKETKKWNSPKQK